MYEVSVLESHPFTRPEHAQDVYVVENVINHEICGVYVNRSRAFQYISDWERAANEKCVVDGPFITGSGYLVVHVDGVERYHLHPTYYRL